MEKIQEGLTPAGELETRERVRKTMGEKFRKIFFS